jgi:hypothetical protein
MASTINASTSTGLVNTADTSGIIKLQSNGKTTNALAWVNFNGVTTTSIRSSYNVSSVTRNAQGDYTINFTTALTDANYSFISTMDWGNTAFGASGRASCIVSLTTTTAQMRTGFLSATAFFTAEDESIICVAIFGN